MPESPTYETLIHDTQYDAQQSLKHAIRVIRDAHDIDNNNTSGGNKPLSPDQFALAVKLAGSMMNQLGLFAISKELRDAGALIARATESLKSDNDHRN